MVCTGRTKRMMGALVAGVEYINRIIAQKMEVLNSLTITEQSVGKHRLFYSYFFDSDCTYCHNYIKNCLSHKAERSTMNRDDFWTRTEKQFIGTSEEAERALSIDKVLAHRIYLEIMPSLEEMINVKSKSFWSKSETLTEEERKRLLGVLLQISLMGAVIRIPLLMNEKKGDEIVLHLLGLYEFGHEWGSIKSIYEFRELEGLPQVQELLLNNISRLIHKRIQEVRKYRP